MTNPGNAIGTNAAYSGRTSVDAFNDVLGLFVKGVLSGWRCTPKSGMTVQLGGNGTERDVAIAEDNEGNKTTINNRSGAPVEVTIGAAPASNARRDAVIAYVDKPTSDSSATPDNPGVCGIIVVEGTPSANPQLPDDATRRAAITADGGNGTSAYYVLLAAINVPAGTTAIPQNMITRGQSPMNVEPVVAGGNPFYYTATRNGTLVVLGFVNNLWGVDGNSLRWGWFKTGGEGSVVATSDVLLQGGNLVGRSGTAYAVVNMAAGDGISLKQDKISGAVAGGRQECYSLGLFFPRYGN